MPDLDITNKNYATGGTMTAAEFNTSMTEIETWCNGAGNIDEDRLADGAATTNKILNEAITNAKLKHTDGHIAFAPEASKLVKIAVLRQNNTTDVYENNSVILTGWGYCKGDSATGNTEEKIITFGIEFEEIPIVSVIAMGRFRDNTDPEKFEEFPGFDRHLAFSLGHNTENITKTTCGVVGYKDDGNTIDTRRYGFTWTAKGVLA